MSVRAKLLTTNGNAAWKVWIAWKCFNLLTIIMNRCGCWIETSRPVEDLYPVRGEA